MYRMTWRLTSAIRAQAKIVMSVPKTVSVPITSFSTLPPGEGEGFGGDLTIGEQQLISKLKSEFPNATHLQVSDVSGGCGAMYQISIETPEFIGKKRIQQHQMVNEVLTEEIKQMHGLQLNTQEPKSKP